MDSRPKPFQQCCIDSCKVFIQVFSFIPAVHIVCSSVITVRCVKDRPTAFAYELHKSMKGAGTDDDPLIRITVSRAEIDMVQIKEAFQRDYEQSLAEFISVSGPNRVQEA